MVTRALDLSISWHSLPSCKFYSLDGSIHSLINFFWISDETWGMLRDDLLVLYKFKKAALGIVFGVGLVLGFLIRGLFGGGKSKKD